MKAADLFRELVFPLTDMTLLMAMFGFGTLLWLADAGGWFGLWLLFIIVPAAFRYAIYLLEARASGRHALVAGIEIFNIIDNLWGIVPLVLLLGFVWLDWYVLQHVSLLAAQSLLVAFLLVYPASLAVLGVTRSPVDSVNPGMLYRMVRKCGVTYFFIPISLAVVLLATQAFSSAFLPGFAIYFIGFYPFFLLFTLTGAIVHASGVAGEVDIEAPLVATEQELADGRTAAWQKVANHAYGFISRGNREGGFAHIRQAIAAANDADEAVAWFFNEMMNWETKEAALFFAQECFAHFLHHDQDTRALKLMSRCLYEEGRWKPKAEDRPAAIALAKRHGREDLLVSLQR